MPCPLCEASPTGEGRKESGLDTPGQVPVMPAGLTALEFWQGPLAFNGMDLGAILVATAGRFVHPGGLR